MKDMCTSLLKAPKRSPFPLRLILVLFVTIFGAYVLTVCVKQISIDKKSNNVRLASEKKEMICSQDGIPHKEIRYLHFPQPRTYSRGECSCNPVRFFVLLSMQRSGSGWFETLLNSHPNISSNGEIFSVKERRSNISSILRTLDTVYSLDWLSSAAKNECLAAVGFKWMLNQGVMDHHKEILDYFKLKEISVIFLFRRNLLRRLISVLANDYDRYAKQLNGIHKSHVHTKEEAEVLAQFKPMINATSLVSDLKRVEATMSDCLQLFSSTHHIVLYYEDIIRNRKILAEIQEFLGVPLRKLQSRQVKIHTRSPAEHVMNWKDVYTTLNGSQYEHFLQQGDYFIY